MALAERTWERVGERKRDRTRLNESAGYHATVWLINSSSSLISILCKANIGRKDTTIIYISFTLRFYVRSYLSF